MPVAEKTSHTKSKKVQVEIPRRLLPVLTKRYGADIKLIEADAEGGESVGIHKSAWFKRIDKETTPGDSLRIYRETRGFTQEQLAGKLGEGTQNQHISDMENGRRGISKEMAKKLARLFGVPVDRFI